MNYSTDFERSLIGHLGFIPREHNNQDEVNAGRHGEIDPVVSAYQNKAPNFQFYYPTQHFLPEFFVVAGATQNVQLEENRQRFPYQVGLRFFPTVQPLNEVLYGD